MSAAQRIRQGVQAVLAFTHAVDYNLAAAYLTPAQLDLFKQMRRTEQLHSLRVLTAILNQGDPPHDLAVAALLHDVGKSRYPLAVWQKTLVVLARKMLPRLFHRWSQGNERTIWKRPFIVAANHPAWSAELASVTQISERTLWLMRHHADPAAKWQDHPDHHLLKRLQAADDTN